MSILIPIIHMISCHGGPADHFATFTEHALAKGYEVHIYAAGPALKKFEERRVKVTEPFSLEDLSPEDQLKLAEKLAKVCNKAHIIITDVGHSFDIQIQEALAEYAPQSIRYAYYDNPEPYVPGGYSTTAAKVMKQAQKVLFANANLAKEPIYAAPSEEVSIAMANRIGLGYYPIEQADQLHQRRLSEKSAIRSLLLKSHNIDDKGQKIIVYFGGNNSEYFDHAFPAFVKMAAKSPFLKDTVILLQQHPGAKKENRDAKLLKMDLENLQALSLIISEIPSDQAQVVADVALYYQTSMGPVFSLAGIPTIQVGHKVYEDLLVKNHLCATATNETEFEKAFIATEQKQNTTLQQRQLIFQKLGINLQWPVVFDQIVEEATRRNSNIKQ